MNKGVRFLIILLLAVILCSCSSKGGSQPGADIDKALALKFLQGIQNGDKKAMYEAANLTTDMVNDNREKLIHPAQYKQTDQQRKESEHALRISGEIDFFISKIRPMFPKSASLQLVKTTVRGTTDGVRHIEHLIKITYANKTDALADKTGKPVKEMVVRLQQLTRPVGGRPVHKFSFESKDFEKIADKDFEVLSYF